VPGVKRYEDLVCWRLAYELEREVWAITATGAVVRYFKFRDQIRDSAASAPRTIAEGFGRMAKTEATSQLATIHDWRSWQGVQRSPQHDSFAICARSRIAER
jgi:hypothetical protein